MAVHEYQALAASNGRPRCSCQVARFETHIAVQVSFAIGRQKNIRDDGSFTLRSGTWRPQAEAQVFLLSPSPVVLEKVVARGLVSLGGQHSFVPI